MGTTGLVTCDCMSAHSPQPASRPAERGAWWPWLTGVFLGFALLKLGNPVILDHIALPPQNLGEAVRETWPAVWGYGVLAVVAGLGFLNWRWPRQVPWWVLALPLVWLAWQLAAATTTVDRGLTMTVLPHFLATIVCFGLGLSAGGARGARFAWVGLLVGLLLVLGAGFRQQYGGLANDREFFEQNEKTGWKEVSAEHIRELLASRLLVPKPDGSLTGNPDLLAKLAKHRIFGTLVYPNALAGVVLLLLPGALSALWSLTTRLQNVTRGVLVGLVAYMGLACLYWSGSKAGWLIGLMVGVVALLHAPWSRRFRLGVVLALSMVGSAGFVWKYQSYFAGGAKSAGARFDYWKVGWATAVRHPVLGSGPGTFYAVYRQTKPPEAEMARLAHNDYLQQAADSGLIGMLAFGGLIWGSLVGLYWLTSKDWSHFSVWLGLTGWAFQEFVEFGLYIPALAWTAFFLFGWLWTKVRNEFDTVRLQT